jgi:hypothetical protein
MTRFPRLLLAPLSVAAAFAVGAPAAQAVSTVKFPESGTTVTTVAITDPSPASDTVHLVVTAADASKLASTKVFLGGDGSAPYFSVGVDGVRDARYDAEGESGGDLSTSACSVIDSSLRYDSAPVTVAPGGASFSADLPKGEVISFQSTGVAVGIVGVDPPCDSYGFHGLAINYVNDHQRIDGFDWEAPPAPVVTAVTGGRRQVALSFDQKPGTSYDIYRVVDGVRSATPFRQNIRGSGDDVQVVLTEDDEQQSLTPGTQYAFQVQAVRLFNVISGNDVTNPTSPFSATATATTAAAQVVRFTTVPQASTTDRNARFSWSIDANADGEAPFCFLDETNTSATEVPCTATGANVEGLSVGTHTLAVYPSDGEGTYQYTWSVTAVPATPSATPAAPTPAPAPATPAAPAAPKNLSDLDGDGISNTWLVAGKPAPAPGTPKATVTGGRVKLKLAAAPKGATKVRVYRADGKAAFKLVKTLAPKSSTFTDAKVKAGHTYKYKTVGVNAKGQQGKASKSATATVRKKK